MGKRQLYYESDKKITAQRLREAMNDANISASELAEQSKVSKSSISQYYNAKQCPSNLSATAMAKVLNVDPVWLMGFDVPRNEEEKHMIEQAQNQEAMSIRDVYTKLGFDYYRLCDAFFHLPQEGQKELKSYLDYIINKFEITNKLYKTDEEAEKGYFDVWPE